MESIRNNKVRFKCPKHGVWFWANFENKGKCTICHTPKEVPKEPHKKSVSDL